MVSAGQRAPRPLGTLDALTSTPHAADTARPQDGVLACCGEVAPVIAEERLEHILPTILSRSSIEHEWFVVTTGETWWHLEHLEAELARLEVLMWPATPRDSPLLLGGGGYIVFANFMILSRPSLELLGDPALLKSCRAGLVSCNKTVATPNHWAVARSLGCRHGEQVDQRRDASYTGSQLVNYCLLPYLARATNCGETHVGCEVTCTLHPMSAPRHPPTNIRKQAPLTPSPMNHTQFRFGQLARAKEPCRRSRENARRRFFSNGEPPARFGSYRGAALLCTALPARNSHHQPPHDIPSGWATPTWLELRVGQAPRVR